jgi:anti-anti-sigma regulatory factor
VASAPIKQPNWRTIELKPVAEAQCTVVKFLNKDLRQPIVVKEMESEMMKMAEFIKTKRLVIDFAGVDNASSAVFGLVLAASMDAGTKGIVVRVCSLTPVLKKAFELLSAKDIVEIHPDVRAACLTSWDKKKGWWPF